MTTDSMARPFLNRIFSPIGGLVLVVALTPAAVLGQSSPEVRQAALAAATKKVAEAEAETQKLDAELAVAANQQKVLDDARADALASHQRRQRVLQAAEADLQRLGRRFPPDKQAIARAEAAVNAHRSTLQALAEGYERAEAAFNQGGARVSALGSSKQNAEQALADALNEQIAAPVALGEDEDEYAPPYLTEVKAYSASGLVYHRRWVAKEPEVDNRIAVMQAFANSLPKLRAQREAEVLQWIAQTEAAVKVTESSMDAYRSAVNFEAGVRATVDAVDSAQTIALDTFTTGGAGGVISVLNESFKAYENYAQIGERYGIDRLGAFSAGREYRAQTSEDLFALGQERYLTEQMELARKKTTPAPASKTLAENRAEMGNAARARRPSFSDTPQAQAAGIAAEISAGQVLRQQFPSVGDVHVDVLVTDLKKQAASNVWDIATGSLDLEPDNLDDMYQYLVDRTRGTAADRAVKTRQFLTSARGNFFGSLAMDEVLAPLKDAALKAATRQRLEAYSKYVNDWAYQVWLENEVIWTARDALLIRRTHIGALQELERQIRIKKRDLAKERELKPVKNGIFDDSEQARLELRFSRPVILTRVTVADRVVSGSSRGATWTGTVDLAGLPKYSEIRVDAHSPEPKFQLDNPYSVAYWSPDDGRWKGYTGEVDDHHSLAVEHLDSGVRPDTLQAGATGITVVVADVFGPQGIRVIPAPGVLIQVVDADGLVKVKASTGNTFEGEFLALAPGAYNLRLDIGDYKPSLPVGCDQGYVREFTIRAGQRLNFSARVYSAVVDANGTSVGTVAGDCIVLRQ
jgi:hypothetical protein